MSSPVALAAHDAVRRAEEVRETLEKSHDLTQTAIDAMISRGVDGELAHVVRVLTVVVDDLFQASLKAQENEGVLYKQYHALSSETDVQEDEA